MNDTTIFCLYDQETSWNVTGPFIFSLRQVICTKEGIELTPENSDFDEAEQNDVEQNDVEQTDVEQTDVEQADVEGQTDVEEKDAKQTGVNSNDADAGKTDVEENKENIAELEVKQANLEQTDIDLTNSKQANIKLDVLEPTIYEVLRSTRLNAAKRWDKKKSTESHSTSINDFGYAFNHSNIQHRYT